MTEPPPRLRRPNKILVAIAFEEHNRPTVYEVDVRTKVPILWRLPIIGKRWFTHTEMQDKKTDLIIEVRPSIIKDNYSGIDKKEYHKDAEDKIFNDE